MTKLRVALFLGLLSAIAPTSLAERLPVKIYTSADGLGSSASFNLVRDERGFIWLCSRDGLIRFDGYRFITYKIGSDDSEPSVFNLLPTRQGSYWINLNRGTDYRFTPRSDRTLLEPVSRPLAKNDPRVQLNADPLIDTPIPGFEDSSGNLWMSGENGMYLLKQHDGRLTPERIELKLPISPGTSLGSFAFSDGRDGALWVGTNWGVVRRLPNSRMIHFGLNTGNQNDPVRYLAEDKESRVWIARPDGLLVLKVEPTSELTVAGDISARTVNISRGVVNSEGIPTLPGAPNEAVLFSFADLLRRDQPPTSRRGNAFKPLLSWIICASDGKVWIIGNHGLVVFDGKRFQHYTTEHGLASNSFSSIVEDNEANIWLASYGGLHRLNPNGLIAFDEKDGFERERTHSIYEDRNGELQVVSGNFNISSFRNGAFQMVQPRIPSNSTWAWQSSAALLDSHGDWWINTSTNVYRFAAIERLEDLAGQPPTAVFNSSNGLISDNTSHVFEDSRGDIWISTFPASKRQGLTRWERKSGKLQNFFTEDGLPAGASASAFAEDQHGTLWFGFYGGGIARYRDQRFTTVNDKDGVPGGTVTSIYRDRAGRIWIASASGGLSRVENPSAEHPSFKRYTIAEGLTSNNLRCITEDLNGQIYVGTVRGVNRLDPETGRIKYYGTSDGLASDFVSAAYRDRSGAIWFGTFNGLSKLVPEPDKPPRPPTVLISALRIAGVDYSVSPLGQQEVFVPEQSANRNNLQIDFLSTASGGNNSTRYQYMLEGADSEWSSPSTEPFVTFANLSSGSYRFLVRAINAENIVSQQPASVSFVILRPIWQRWWFITLTGLLLLGLGYATYRYRLAQLLQVERVRTRIATDLHDDIGASLSRMAILSEVVKQQTPENNGQSGRLLTEIADSARGLVDSMGDIVWSIDPRRDDLRSVVLRVRQFASDVLEAQGITWEFKVPEELERIKLDPEQRRHLFLIFKESINNIARHAAGASKVEISLTVRDHQLIGEISDNGPGFDKDSISQPPTGGRGGNGLPNMVARAEQLGGHLNVDSKAGSGTLLKLVVPLR